MCAPARRHVQRRVGPGRGGGVGRLEVVPDLRRPDQGRRRRRRAARRGGVPRAGPRHRRLVRAGRKRERRECAARARRSRAARVLRKAAPARPAAATAAAPAAVARVPNDSAASQSTAARASVRDPAAGSAAPPLPFATRTVRSVLANGLVVDVVENRAVPLVSVRGLVMAGNVQATGARSALPALTEKMLARGTTSRSKEAIGALLADVGAERRYVTTPTHVGIEADGMARDLPLHARRAGRRAAPAGFRGRRAGQGEGGAGERSPARRRRHRGTRPGAPGPARVRARPSLPPRGPHGEAAGPGRAGHRGSARLPPRPLCRRRRDPGHRRRRRRRERDRAGGEALRRHAGGREGGVRRRRAHRRGRPRRRARR